jgi:hypothetical protein
VWAVVCCGGVWRGVWEGGEGGGGGDKQILNRDKNRKGMGSDDYECAVCMYICVYAKIRQ